MPKSNRGSDVDLSLPHFKKFVVGLAAICLVFGALPFIVALCDYYPTVDEPRAMFLREILNS